MAISKKKQKEIKSKLSNLFHEVLNEYEGGKNSKVQSAKGSTNWFDDPPDTWTEYETHIFDMLSTALTRAEIRVLEILNK